MNEHFSAVIVGSGFGGSVMAYRLAQAGQRVCLLERGKPYPPHSFPRAPYDLGRNFWDPSEGLYGLYNIWSFKGSGALVTSGVGGGSLIYANIMARKDAKWFQDTDADGAIRPWPVQYADLERHYQEVERMMNAQKYPLNHPPYDNTPKTRAMQEAAQRLNPENKPHLQWLPLNLAVSFRRRRVGHPDEDAAENPPLVGAQIAEDFPNYHTLRQGYPALRATCQLCGECDLGCNYGSKNTLDYTYLTHALHQRPYPADIRPLCEVKTIAPREDAPGYTVTYLRHEPEKYAGQKVKAEKVCKMFTVTCDRLILSAGTFGTPFLLLKNRASFPRLSQRLGERYCVNGDLLSFIKNSMERKNGHSVPRRLDPSFGPVITSAIRFADTLDGVGATGSGFYVEDGGNPYFLSWMAELSGFPGYLRRTFRFLKIITKYRLGFNQDADLGAEIADLAGPANTTKSSLPILTMGRDRPDGRLHLTKDGRLECDWSIKTSHDYYERVRRSVRAIARALNAEYMDNPSYAWNFHQVLTAHPLGGCAMAENADGGVVDQYGAVFGHPGLYVADGSMLPGPVGPNPSLTIAALANRLADHIIA